jgi:1-acyl-sn-glycerol-3-phosphate acyltransferase
MAFTFFLPFFFLGPAAGWLADRLPRRGIMIFADACRILIMFAFAGLIAWTQAWGPWGPFLPLLLVGGFAALFSPARSALLPSIIPPEQLIRANGMLAGLGIIATMAANLAGGVLARHYPPTVAFRLDAATFLASAVLLAFMRPPAPAEHTVEDSGNQLRELVHGFTYVRTHRRVAQLLIIAGLVWFCGALVNSVIPAVVRDVYHMEYQAMSGFRAFLGLGFILGAVIITILGDALRSEVAITWAFFGISASIALFSASVFLPLPADTLFAVGAVGVVGSGVFGVTVMASFDSLLQRIVPDHFRGRVFGVRDVCTTASLLLATGLLAVPQWQRLDEWVGWILAAVAVVTLAAGVTTLAIRLRRSSLPRHAIAVASNVNEFVAKFWYRLRRVGPSTVPQTGPVIVTANHRCPADPIFICAAAPYRLISFMIAAEYSGWPIFRSFLRWIESIPVRRGAGDMGATQRAIQHLREGKALGIFIEGGIVAPGETPHPKDGVALLALRTGATVVPAYISGVRYRPGMLHGLLTRHRARVRFGRPVDLAEFRDRDRDKESVRAATRKIYAAVLALAPEEESPSPAPQQEHSR